VEYSLTRVSVKDLTRDNTTPVPWRFIVFNFLFSRLWILVVAGLSMLVINEGQFHVASRSALDWLNQWDTRWYLSIIRQGYSYHPGMQSNVAFFPLYPMLVRVLSLGGALDHRIAGYLVSLGALFIATVALWKLARLDLGDEAEADRCIQFLLFAPPGVFFSSIYPESLFLASLVGSLYFARTQRWLLAGLCGYAAGLTRTVSVLLAIPLVLEYLLQQRGRFDLRRAETWQVLLCCSLPALGLLTYMGYLGWVFGDPFASSNAQAVWARHLNWPWFPFFHLNHYDPFYRTWFVCFAIVAAALFILGLWWRLRPSYLVLLFIFMLIYLSSNRLESLPRYMSVLFPFYFVLALIARKWPNLTTPLFVASGGLQALSVILFVNGYWFT